MKLSSRLGDSNTIGCRIFWDTV